MDSKKCTILDNFNKRNYYTLFGVYIKNENPMYCCKQDMGFHFYLFLINLYTYKNRVFCYGVGFTVIAKLRLVTSSIVIVATKLSFA